MKTEKRFISYFLLSASVMIVLNFGLALINGAIVGDLTRIGGFAEKQYGWNQTQPNILITDNKTSINDADVIILGDSFSRLNAWQSEL